jgi:deoxyxylulose-5-phosphate synthase
MAHEVARRSSYPSYSTRRILGRLHNDVITERGGISAVAGVAEHGMYEITYLTKIKNELAMACPDASEALALIANTAAMSIAHKVARFGQDVTW